jgi:hypothetical protein
LLFTFIEMLDEASIFSGESYSPIIAALRSGP